MRTSTSPRSDAVARLLGAVSLGLGASELVAPDTVVSIAGVRPSRRTRLLTRALGARECGHGAAILLGAPRLVWTRVVGDVLDVALLAAGLVKNRSSARRGAVALLVLSGIGAADVYAASTTGVGGAHAAPSH
ncbi:hypothetical protein FIV07_21295 [Mycobacterium sp. THAF192]|nr:hypothetical protein FIV07_21295 [Mycobacterium sp. THAF192]